MAAPQKVPDADSAWAAYEPSAARPWTLPLAGHLGRRAGLGWSWPQLSSALADGPKKAIDRLLRPSDADEFNRDRDRDEAAAIDPAGGELETLQEWWLRRMIETPHPLLETMTLFWHNLLGVSAKRVENARLVQQHVAMLRAHALGKFDQLLAKAVLDPAVLLGWNGEANRKARPSEAFARNLLGVLGFEKGDYRDEDVRGIARAMTGWFVIKFRLRYIEHERDTEEKDIFGRLGDWKPENAVRIILQQPAALKGIVRRLDRWLVSETQPAGDALLAPLVKSFAEGLDIAKLVETVLRSRRFFSPAAYRQKVKSPVEFAVGTIRALEALVPTRPLAKELGRQGQELGAPPTLAGWPGGPAWLDSFAATARANLAAALFSNAEPYKGKLDPAAIVRRHGRGRPAADFLLDLFLQGDAGVQARQAVTNLAKGEDAARLAAQAIVALPEYQLA